MITEEQIKNLKPGDLIIIHGAFWSSTEQGDISVTCPMTYETKLVQDCKYIHPTCCYLPSEAPKYDPKRLFKKGDKVRIIEWNGRDIARVGQIGYVVADEYNSKVELVIDGRKKDVYYPVCHLELVTPVEELPPYYVTETDIEFQVRMKVEEDDCLISAFRFKNIVEGYKKYHAMLPEIKQARERAEAECERLNAEWRKDQNL